jgi:Peptidase A4 family
MTAVSGQFTVPTLNCSRTPNAGESEWVGIGGNGGSSGDLLQTGVVSDCRGGVQYDNVGWWEEYPQYPEIDFKTMSVSPGDQIAASVYRASDGTWVTRVDDLTTGVSGVMNSGNAWGTILDSNPSTWYVREGNASTVSYAGAYTAEWIVEAYGTSGGGQTQLADFGTIAFTNVKTSLPSWSLTTNEAVGLGDKNGYLLAAPSAPQGDGFSVAYTGG